MEPQVTASINEKIDEIANMVRASVRNQRDIWRTVPHWTLEAEGRSGWRDNASLTYNHLLYPLSGHHSTVYVDCYAGELVDSRLGPATSREIVETYAKMVNWDAVSVVTRLMTQATSDSRPLDDIYRKRDDTSRESLRQRYNVKPVCDRPATAIKWSYAA